VSLLLLQQTEASFLATFILAGSAVITFELFTHEWSRNPARVAAAQEARQLVGRASAAVSAARADALDVRSSVSGQPDCMGMNLADGAQKVQQEAADLGISAGDLVRAQRGNLAFSEGVQAPHGVAPLPAWQQRQPRLHWLPVECPILTWASKPATQTLYDWASKLGRQSWGQCNGRNTLSPLPRT